jgi:segregation and condensation protein A
VTFVVTTPSFSGPVELLLQLISTHDMDILDVPLGPIVDAFVAVLRDDRSPSTSPISRSSC